MKLYSEYIALIVLGLVYCINYAVPMHWDSIVEQYELSKDVFLFEKQVTELRHYYKVIYESEVQYLCDQAAAYFITCPVSIHSAIIFDIDDTVFYSYHNYDSVSLIWQEQEWLINARKNNWPCAIKPVFMLYKELINRGFKIIFLSARNETAYALTVRDLKKVGYDQFEKVILMPAAHAYDRTTEKVAAWKLSVRMKLAQKYDIVGCIADRSIDFFGGYTGFEVRLPNYLY